MPCALGRAVGRTPASTWQHRAAMELGVTLDVRTRAAWRAWLLRNHARKKEIWLVYHAKASGGSSISYNDAVDEAICFGWIDSTVKKVGAHSRAQRFTPRRKGSPISEMNKARARRLVREGRMTAVGRAALGSALRREALVVAPDVSHASVIEQKRIPSAKSARNGGASAATNWGSRLGKKTAIFGLVRLLSTPCRSADAVGTRAPPRSRVGCASRPRNADQSEWAPR